ncbi:MAG: hypothetical protein RMN51_03565, partial [Verrucomicrobiota bacterium]|nr:hypothetical protein [Verrucomicrobiota bacterium]
TVVLWSLLLASGTSVSALFSCYMGKLVAVCIQGASTASRDGSAQLEPLDGSLALHGLLPRSTATRSRRDLPLVWGDGLCRGSLAH